MKEKILKVTPKLGLHAKPAAMFVSEAGKFKCAIKVIKDGTEINGKSVMGLMLLGAAHGTKLRITADGPDEAAALAALETLFERKFDED